ncbi:MAG: YdiU family protein [Candidatus Melainabacteria bacterium]
MVTLSTTVIPMSVITGTETTQTGWQLENSYAGLPDVFFRQCLPTPVVQPAPVILNHTLARTLGLEPDSLMQSAGLAVLAGNQSPPGAQPIAQAYAGHQFGHFTMLGDGRALLLGEQRTPDGRLTDIQLKGAGPTPYSRRGDGRAALGPMLREYLISEAMHALGIPTTRSLAVVTTGEPVYRETPLAGAVLTRVAASHIRVGTFEYAAALDQPDRLRALADYTIHRHDPALAEAGNPCLELLRAAIQRQAALVALWQSVGFIHGVMNTDNMTLSGETIDYGPCAFMDVYDPATVFSSIDHHGRYAYANQPPIAQWNLSRLAISLLPLLDTDPRKAAELAQEAVDAFETVYHQAWLSCFRAKLGLMPDDNVNTEEDSRLIGDLLAWMHSNRQDFTLTFERLTTGGQNSLSAISGFTDWENRWQARLQTQADPDGAGAMMRSANPVIIPRNRHVEAALTAAAHGNDLQPFRKLLEALQSPYNDSPDKDAYREPGPETPHYRTFCGT